MRKLILLRGLPGCGKSTFVREQGLEPYTLSADTLRMQYASPILEASGAWRISPEHDRDVWAKLFELLRARMSRGELIVIDATHTHPRSFSNYQALVREHRYQTLCVDFETDLETCQERNQSREPWKIVPPLEMERMAQNLQRSKLPNWITSIAPQDLEATLTITPTDVSQYAAINHIGDIQGCFTPLAEYFETYGMNDDELYIFVGDYLDRGTQNAEVMNWLLENYHRPNFVFLEGNHEAHLRNWTQGSVARSRQFTLATKPELEAANISPKKVHGFLYKLREVYYYTFHGRTVIITHGGLSTLPDRLSLVSSRQLIRGAGVYEEADIADANFAATTPTNTYQVHGHRNRYSSPTQVNERCFNLEGKVEFGGELRTVRLTPDGFEERSIASTIDASDVIVEPAGPRMGAPEDVAELVATLRAAGGIYEKPQADTSISSFNFTRDVFYKKAWDDINVHARGLFINTESNTIVARSYEKFFNLGERPETQPDTLMNTLAFPVRAWVKENGYLGMVGYDATANTLLFASKSSLTSDFAGWLKQQFEGLAPAGSKTRQEIELYLKSEGGKTLVFEVIEPANDPHIIEHDTPHLILLDIVKNTVTFEAHDETERERIAKMLGCASKQQAAILKDAAALQGWLASVRQFDYLYQKRHIEGFVLEDSRGFMVKIKLPWYAFWRQMRTQLQRLQGGKTPQLPSLEINNELAQLFLDYLGSLEPEAVQQADIVALRRAFEASRPTA